MKTALACSGKGKLPSVSCLEAVCEVGRLRDGKNSKTV